MKFKKILALALALCMINSVVSPALADEFAGDIGTVEIIPDQPAEEIVDICEDCAQEPCVCESVVEYCADCGEALTEGHVCAEEEPQEPEVPVVEKCECGLEKGHEGDCAQVEPEVEYCAECGEVLTEGHECAVEPEVEYCAECGEVLTEGHECAVEPEVEYCAECGEVLTEGHVCAEEPVCICAHTGDEHMDFCPLYEEPEYSYCEVCEEILDEDGLCPVCDQHAALDIVEFTDVAPFLDPVEAPVASTWRLRSPYMLMAAADDDIAAQDEESTGADVDGLETTKTVVNNGDGTYTITLENYVTGNTTVTSDKKDIPTDIVLVLDQSGSMADCIVCGGSVGSNSKHDVYTYTPYSGTGGGNTHYYYKDNNNEYHRAYYYNGRWYDENWDTYSGQIYTRTSTRESCSSRIDALTTAVTNFTTQVANKAKGENGVLGDDDDINHRIAIVGFASQSGYGNNTEILTVEGNNSSYTGGKLGVAYNNLTNTHYQNAFQDMSSSSDVLMVNNAIKALEAEGATGSDLGMEMAKNIFEKDTYELSQGEQRNRVVIMFTDGTPTTQTNFSQTVANGAIGHAKTLKASTSENGYGATVYTVGVFSGANASPLTSASSNENRYMHYVSSNYPKAESMSNNGLKNGETANTGYYLSAGDADTLNNIFQQISNNIQNGTSSVQLGTETVVKDIVTPYFEIPSTINGQANTVKVYTADYNSDGTWDARVESSLTADVNGNTVDVDGFDYALYYCDTTNGREKGDNSQSGDYYGSKLIVEFTIVPKEGFLGGNDVPTNDSASGVYKNSTELTPMETYEYQDTNVLIPKVDIEVSAADKNVYYNGSISYDELRKDSTSVAKITTATGIKTVDLNLLEGLEEWQYEHVYIVYELKDEDGNLIDASGSLNELKEDATYTLSVRIEPKVEKEATEEEAYVATAKDDLDEGKINVFTPELTFKDGNVYYGGTMPTDYDSLLTNTTWKHVDTYHDANGVEMIGNAPTLTLEYSPVTGTVNTKDDIAVNVTDVKIGDVSVPTAFEWESCEIGETKADGAEFQLHVHVPSLTVKDGDVYFGGSMPTADKYNANGNATYTWGTEPGDMLNSKPELSVTYSPVTGTVDTTEDIPVTATLTAGNESVDSKEFQLHVHVPTLTVKDGNVYYGGEMPTKAKYDASGNAVGAWGTVPEVMLNTAPALNVTYTTDKTVVDTKEDIPVTAELFAGSASVESKSFNLHVYLPEFTFTDVSAYYGDAAPSGFTAPDPDWFRGDAAAENMLNAEPKFTMAFENEAGKVQDGFVVTDKAYKVNVASVTCANLGSVDLSNLTFKWEHDGCGLTKINEHTADVNSHEFYVHVNTCSLTITKTGMDTDIDPNEVVVFHVKGNNTKVEVELDVTIHGNGSVTINGLPVGHYSVTEDDKWSWRYTAGENNGAELSSDNPTDTVTVNNTRTNIYWLDFAAWCQNIFDGNNTVKGGTEGSYKRN